MDSAVETWARRFVADAEANDGCPPLHVSGDACLDIARALLSSHAHLERMREALESERAKWDDDPRVFYPDNEVLESLDRLHAALTKEEK